MVKKFFFILTGFQITWFACVLGELYFNSIIGLITGIIYLSIFFYFQKDKKRSLKICIIFSSIGYFFDTIISYYNIYVVKADIIFLSLPIWFLILWPSFSTLLVDILCFFKKRVFLAIISGIFISPSTYYFGYSLGLAEVSNFYFSFFLMAIFWGLFMYIYTLYLNKIDFID